MIAMVAASALAIHFVLSDDTTHRAKFLVAALLLGSLLTTLRFPGLERWAVLVQVALAVGLPSYARDHR